MVYFFIIGFLKIQHVQLRWHFLSNMDYTFSITECLCDSFQLIVLLDIFAHLDIRYFNLTSPQLLMLDLLASIWDKLQCMANKCAHIF